MQTTNDARVRLGDFLTIGALAVAVAVPIWERLAVYGWLELTLGRLPIFWVVVLFWIVAVSGAIRWRKRWWLLATAPPVLYPAAFLSLLMFECSRGNCL